MVMLELIYHCNCSLKLVGLNWLKVKKAAACSEQKETSKNCLENLLRLLELEDFDRLCGEHKVVLSDCHRTVVFHELDL